MNHGERCARNLEQWIADADAGWGAKLAGLKPRCGLIIPAELNQEEIKEALLEQGLALGPYAVMRLEGLAQEIVRRSDGEAPLLISPSLSLEVVKRLVLSAGGGEHFPNLRKKVVHRKQLQSIARALTQGRRSYAHLEEAHVMTARLNEAERSMSAEGPSSGAILFAEFLKLRVAFESWIKQISPMRADSPLLLAQAAELLQSPQAPQLLRALPQEWLFLRVRGTQEPLEEYFLESLRSVSQLHFMKLDDVVTIAESPNITGFIAHTLDDGADALAKRLRDDAEKKSLEQSIIIFNGSPEQRRILNRALGAVGLEQWDSRDPHAFLLDPVLQKSLLPLQMIAQGFAKDVVKDWIASFAQVSVEEKREWLKQVENSGLLGKEGVAEYERVHAGLAQALKGATEIFPGKATVTDWAEAHMAWLEKFMTEAFSAGKFEFITRAWSDLAVDLHALYAPARKFFPSYIFERLRRKLEEMPAPAPRTRPCAKTRGVRVYRLGQMPARAWEKAYVFGLTTADVDQRAAQETHDEWFRRRVRDRLSVDFALRAEHAEHSPRASALQSLRRVIAQSRSVTWMDCQYDPAGKERETAQGLLTELGLPAPLFAPIGCHPVRLASYSTVRISTPIEVKLNPVEVSPRTAWRLSTTAVENYSKCPFLSLLFDRWRLRDVEDADLEMPAHQQGIFLHEVVRRVVEFLDNNPGKVPHLENLIEQTWREKRPQAMLRGERLDRLAQRKLLPILENFLAAELEYRARVDSSRLILDDTELKFQTEVDVPERGAVAVEIKAKPDRVDRLPEGLWIMDYKSGKNTPKARQMLEKGYRLQLPIYALAVAAHFREAVIGAQFVQLHRQGKRSDGIFFVRHNGKGPGKPTDLTKRSHSLLDAEPGAVWEQFNALIGDELRKMATGEFSAIPKLPNASCPQCRARVACGINRREADGESTGESGGEA